MGCWRLTLEPSDNIGVDSDDVVMPVKRGTRTTLRKLASKDQTYDDIINEMMGVYARCVCQHPDVLVIDLRPATSEDQRAYAHRIVDGYFDSKE